MPLGVELMKQAEIMGTNPQFNIINYKMLREMLLNCSEEQIKLYAKHDIQRMQDMDAYIGIRSNSNAAELNEVSNENMELYNKHYMLPVHFHERVKKLNGAY